MKPGYHILEHPADLGIQATGEDLREAFRQAALGLLSVIVDPASVDMQSERTVSIQGSDLENVLIRWLSEVVFLFDGEHFVIRDVEVKEITTTKLEAVVKGEPVRTEKHELRTDVKAVTYHQVHVEEAPGRASVRFFLDI